MLLNWDFSPEGREQIATAIIGHTQDIGQYIGSGFHLVIEPGETRQHTTRIQQYTPSRGEVMPVVLLKLFAFMPLPAYVVAIV